MGKQKIGSLINWNEYLDPDLALALALAHVDDKKIFINITQNYSR